MGKKIEVNVAALEALAGVNPADDLTKFDGMDGQFSGELAEALSALSREERQMKVKAAAAEILKLVQFSDEITACTVQRIRMLRREAQEQTEYLNKVALARAYGMETKNFMPLLSVLQGKNDHQVPKGWAAAAKKAAAKK